jgi:inner membrane protein
LIARLKAAYVPPAEAEWAIVHKYGADPSERELAERVLAHPKLAFYRWFAQYPALYRIDQSNPATCVWFEDLRFTTAGRTSNSFRYGLCSEAESNAWRAYRLRDDGGREPLE